jgi:hypothetical protein
VTKRWVWALAGSVSALLCGCATLQDVAGIPRSGHQQDGTYVVSAEEEKLACRQIRDRLNKLNGQIQAMPAKAALEEQSRPRTVGSALGRMFGGPGAGLKTTTELQRANAESDALNHLLARKQCV